MNNTFSRIIGIISFLVCFTFSHAQELGSGFQQLTLKNGLSNNDVLCIFQDNKGFMWLGTHSGLNKFDGYKFTIFKKTKDATKSLSDNIVRSLGEDSKGNLWIGTNDGDLNMFDKSTGRFSNFTYEPEDPDAARIKYPINSLVIDKNDMVWITASRYGLLRFDKNTEKFTAYVNDPNDNRSILPNSLSSLYINKKGELIVGAFMGISIFDAKTDKFKNFTFEKTQANINLIYQKKIVLMKFIG